VFVLNALLSDIISWKRCGLLQAAMKKIGQWVSAITPTCKDGKFRQERYLDFVRPARSLHAFASDLAICAIICLAADNCSAVVVPGLAALQINCRGYRAAADTVAARRPMITARPHSAHSGDENAVCKCILCTTCAFYCSSFKHEILYLYVKHEEYHGLRIKVRISGRFCPPVITCVVSKVLGLDRTSVRFFF
jgi:hypothetical protein